MQSVREPKYLKAFHCLAAECEDTCCGGWSVLVDHATYNRYMTSNDASLRRAVNEFITIAPAGSGPEYYGVIQMKDGRCPMLADGLCSLQTRYGEEYLPKICAAYPRTMNLVDGTLEESLLTSCPEAARLVLWNPRPMEWVEGEADEARRLSGVSFVDTARVTGGKPYEFFHATRRKAIAILQDRSRGVGRRMRVLGTLCDRLESLARTGKRAQFADALNEAIEPAAAPEPSSAARLELALTVVVERISEYTPAAFRDCYTKFMQGLKWGANDSMDELAARFEAARARYYEPFFRTREYVFENLLVNYMHRTLFPYGPQRSEKRLDAVNAQGGMVDKFRLMAAYALVIETVAVGMAAFYGEGFGEAEMVRVVYGFSRTFEHSATFPPRIIEILTAQGLRDGASAAMLVRAGGA